MARKRWRLYAPHIALAQGYSSDYARKQLGAPLLDVVLEPGDKIVFFFRERERERDMSIYIYNNNIFTYTGSRRLALHAKRHHS